MSKKNVYFVILFFLVVISATKAQIHNFTNYNVGEGIEQSDVLCISQASNGYLLYGSNGGGLGYYDGYNFSSVKEKQGLSNNVVFSISVDKTKKVWLATNSGVNYLSPNLKEIINIYHEGTAFYYSYYSKELGQVFFGSSKGFYYFNGDSLQPYLTKNENLNTAFINSIYTDSKKNIWIATRQRGLFKVDTLSNVTQFTENDGLPSNYIKAIIESDNKIWIGTLNGLALVEKDTVSNFSLPNNADGNLTITAVAKYNGELVFGAMNSHLYIVNPKNNSFKIINENNGFNYKKVWSIFTDAENNLWFGTVGQGLSKFNSIFTYYNQKSGLLNNYITSLYFNKDETWIGYKNGINIIKENKLIKTITPKDIGSSIVNTITKINNAIYIGRNLGLSIYKGDKFENIPFTGNKQNDIYSICKANQEIYIGTKYGLFKLQANKLIQIENTPKDYIFDIIEHNKKLYLATNGGYYIYNKKTFEFINEEKGLKVGRVRSFKLDERNSLWIGTSEGICVLKDNQHIKIDEQKGLSSDNVYFLQADENGNMWAGTNKGVDRINVKSFYENNIKIRSYSKQEGMLGVECNMNAVAYSNSKQLWIGTIDGVYLYNQNEDKINLKAPKITLNNIKLNFNDVDWSKYASSIDKVTGFPQNLELNHTNNNFIFEYVGVSLKNPEKVTYQYKLEGLDDDWLPFTKDKKAVYTALSSGNYTFKLKAKNSDGIWVKEPTTFSFTIFPPWYQTTWFYTSCIILLLLGFYLFVKIRTRNLKKTQLMLTQQVEERTSELREEKEKVEDQKKVIEVANKNITDSINYAQKIQEAILPKGNKLGEYEDSLGVLYLPKDVVSGDFYWYDKLGDKIIIAAADCTGHGVPGAFMSMIGVNNLNQIILENKETNPSNILAQLNVAIKKVLRQEDIGSESKDGMDISICTFDTKNNIVQYAGAFRPLIYMRNNELVEIKGSRNPIGGNAPSEFVYELNEFEYKKEDVFYMFSDGYPDQFGGPKGKKFMNKKLKKIFIEHHKAKPQKQREILKKEFYKWMGEEEQVDDILVMCMKF